MPRVGMATLKPDPLPRPERLLHPRSDNDSAQGHIPRRDALSEDEQVGLEPVALAPEPGTQTSKAGNYLVRYKEHVVFPANLRHPAPVIIWRWVDATCPYDRLAYKGSDAVRSKPLYLFCQGLDRVVRDPSHARHQLPKALSVGGDPCQAGAVGVHTMVRKVSSDYDLLFGPAYRVPVAPYHRVPAQAARCARRALGSARWRRVRR